MQNTQSRLDSVISRVLFVTPQVSEPTKNDDRAERAFSFALLFSGVRCIIMYAILPFVLPIIGIAGTFSLYLDIAINMVAICAIIYSLRRFWLVDYKHKWSYLPVALVALVVLIAFIVLDVAQLL